MCGSAPARQPATQSDADTEARTVASPAVFRVPATMGRRLGELGVAGLWAVLLTFSLFPPSGEYGMTWFMAPLGALGVTHFFGRRRIEIRPTLLGVDGARLAELIAEGLEDFERRDLGLGNGAVDRLDPAPSEDANDA